MALATTPLARFNQIMSSKTEINFSHEGQTMRLRVSNVTPNVYNEKLASIVDIYNTNAFKASVIDSDYGRQTYAQAKALEQAGQLAEADKLFTELMNKSTLSFSVINRGDGTAKEFVKDQVILCPIEIADSTDGRRSIVTVKPYAAAAIMGKKSNRFSETLEATPPVAPSVFAGGTVTA